MCWPRHTKKDISVASDFVCCLPQSHGVPCRKALIKTWCCFCGGSFWGVNLCVTLHVTFTVVTCCHMRFIHPLDGSIQATSPLISHQRKITFIFGRGWHFLSFLVFFENCVPSSLIRQYWQKNRPFKAIFWVRFWDQTY